MASKIEKSSKVELSSVRDADSTAFGEWTPLKPKKGSRGREESPFTASTRASSPTASEIRSEAGSTRSGRSARSARSHKPRVLSDVQLGAKFCDEIHLSADSGPCRQMVLNMLNMLHRCGYEHGTIVMVLAVALVHLDHVFPRMDKRIDDTEAVSIAVMQCFHAHSYLIDEPCPLRYWHANIYANYCDVQVLNIVAYKLLKLLKYNLSVTDAELEAKLAILGYGPDRAG